MPVSAEAHPNIAFIKYWGDVEPGSHLPANGSISMNLSELITRTQVVFDSVFSRDEFTLNGKPLIGDALARVSAFLDRVREMAGFRTFARVESENNFPIGVGIASSAAGFAALSLAATTAAGLELDEKSLSRLARTGSGSACRSVPAGFVEWKTGSSDTDSYAYSISPPEYWDLLDCVTIVSQEEKGVGSTTGHTLAHTSPLQASRVLDTPHRLGLCRQAILERDFDKLAEVVELDSNLMHAVMITSNPPLFYWLPGTIKIIQAVLSMRKAGLPVCYTVDAGPNVHVLSHGAEFKKVVERLRQLPGVLEVLTAHPGGPAYLLESSESK